MRQKSVDAKKQLFNQESQNISKLAHNQKGFSENEEK